MAATSTSVSYGALQHKLFYSPAFKGQALFVHRSINLQTAISSGKFVNNSLANKLLAHYSAPLQGQQILFVRQAASIARQRPRTADYSMARHNNRNRIAPIGSTDCPHRTRLAQAGGQLRITGGITIRNVEQGAPNALLEWRTGRQVQRHIKLLPATGKIFGQLLLYV
jgi:hypothetical protein